VVSPHADQEHAAALLLQRSLLPTTPRHIPGFELAARYVPAEVPLGGDWFDVFELPGGRVGMVMGDVAGHGLQAAIIMGRLRSALRAYALDTFDPALVLHRLDRKILHFEEGALATVLYGVTDPSRTRIDFSSAGHWPPIVAAPGQGVSEMPLPTDLLLGVDSSIRRRSASFEIREGTTLCLFTDGLIERRPAADDPAAAYETQIGKVQRSLSSSLDTEHVATDILRSLVQHTSPQDDIALLLARRTA
jgi:phosphoserine phosphatase RsbU/P